MTWTNFDRHAHSFRTLHELLQSSGEDERIRAQAVAWSRMAQLAREMAIRLKTARDAVFPQQWDPEQSAAGKVVHDNITKVVTSLEGTCDTAVSNHTGAMNIADAIQTAQRAMKPLYQEYYGIVSTIAKGGDAGDYYRSLGVPHPHPGEEPYPSDQRPAQEWWERDLFNRAKPHMQRLATAAHDNWYQYLWHMPPYDGPMMANPAAVMGAFGPPGASAPPPAPAPPPRPPDAAPLAPPAQPDPPPTTTPMPPPPDSPPGPVLQGPPAPPATPPVTPGSPVLPGPGAGPGGTPGGLVPPGGIVLPPPGRASPVRPPSPGGRTPFAPPAPPVRGGTGPGLRPPASLTAPPVLGGSKGGAKAPGARQPSTRQPSARDRSPLPPASPAGRGPARTPGKPGAPGKPGVPGGATPPVIGGTKPDQARRPPARGGPGATPPVLGGNRSGKPVDTTPGPREKILGRGRPGPRDPAGRGAAPPVGGHPHSPRSRDPRRTGEDDEFSTDLVEDDIWSVELPVPAVIEPPAAKPYHGRPAGPAISSEL